MTKTLTEWDLYHIFSVDCRGDTLVIAPRGDAAGFPETQFRLAVQRLHDALERCGARNLIVDLSDIDYPGLEMLTAIRDLVAAVRSRGGTAALAGPSNDTIRVLQEHAVGQDWTFFPDRATAVQRVVRETWRQRLSRHRRLLAVAAAIILVPLVLSVPTLSLFRTSEAEALAEVRNLWARYHELQRLPLDAERDRAMDKLAARAAGLRAAFLGKKLPKAADAAGGLVLIIGSPIQPDPRAAAFEKQLLADMRAQDDSEVPVLTAGARRVLRLVE
jgi:anti-anti-sigma regulatory factor